MLGWGGGKPRKGSENSKSSSYQASALHRIYLISSRISRFQDLISRVSSPSRLLVEFTLWNQCLSTSIHSHRTLIVVDPSSADEIKCDENKCAVIELYGSGITKHSTRQTGRKAKWKKKKIWRGKLLSSGHCCCCWAAVRFNCTITVIFKRRPSKSF